MFHCGGVFILISGWQVKFKEHKIRPQERRLCLCLNEHCVFLQIAVWFWGKSPFAFLEKV